MVKQISLPIVVRRMAVITLSRFNRMFDLAEWTALVLPPLCQVLTKMTVPQYPRLPGETSADLAEIDLWAHLISLLKSFIIKVGGQQPSTVRMLRRTLAATLRPWNQSAIAAIQSVRKFQDQDMSRSLSKLVERQSVCRVRARITSSIIKIPITRSYIDCHSLNSCARNTTHFSFSCFRTLEYIGTSCRV